MIKVNGLGVSRIPINGKETLRVMKNGKQLWSGTGLPAGYTLLEYIESTGQQYIDTGFKPNNNTRVVFDGQFINTPSANNVLFGARTSATSKNYAIMCLSGGAVRSDYNNVYTQTWDSVGIERFVIDKNKETTTMNGVSQSYTNSLFQCEYNMFLFALNNAGSSRWASSIKMFSCQIYDNGTIVRDYIPCINSEGICGLFDKVNRVFYQSATLTGFIV